MEISFNEELFSTFQHLYRLDTIHNHQYGFIIILVILISHHNAIILTTISHSSEHDSFDFSEYFYIIDSIILEYIIFHQYFDTSDVLTIHIHILDIWLIMLLPIPILLRQIPPITTLGTFQPILINHIWLTISWCLYLIVTRWICPTDQ